MKKRNIILLIISFLAFCSPLFAPRSHALSTHIIITNFTAGEISPLMAGRTDMAKYQSGCIELENFFVYPQGPVTVRPGFQYIAETKTSAKQARLIPFKFSTEQAYVLEFGDQYIRFFADQGQVLWESGGSPYEIVSPYGDEDLDDLKYCQSADVMYLTHPDHDVYIMERSGHTNFAITSISGASAFTSDPFTGVNDYPSCCTFHENRLIFANTNAEPNTAWLSKSGDFTDFTTGVADDDAIIMTLASDQVNAIQWLVPSIYLTLGTTAGEWRISATDPDDPITPTNITAKRELVYGSYDRMAVHIGKDILFIQGARRKIRKLAYNWESAGYVAPDMNVLAEHITESGVSELVYQQNPFSTLWATRADGVLPALTYLPEHEVFAWHRHTTQGYFESAAVIPGDMQDDLYVITRREIDSAVSRFVEVLGPQFTSESLADAIQLDSSISYEGAPATVLSGATHLRNMPVYALAGGEVVSGITVDGSGGVTIPDAASTVHIGLPYTATLKTMRLEAPAEDGGTSQGRIKRISKAILRLYKTKNFQAGPDADNLLEVETESGTTNLFTGDAEIHYPGGYEKDAHITVVQDDPLPLTILSIVVKATTGD